MDRVSGYGPGKVYNKWEVGLGFWKGFGLCGFKLDQAACLVLRVFKLSKLQGLNLHILKIKELIM